jgi:hypothetical protein
MKLRRRRAWLVIMLTVAVGACATERDEDRPVSKALDSAPPSMPVPPVAAAAGDSGLAARAPDSLFVRRGACPFECCVYGDWALETAAPVRAVPDSAAAELFTLRANQRFRADSGFVRITERQLVVVHDTIDQRPFAALFVPGDTLLVLDYVGEGHYKVWTGTKIVEVEGFWGAGSSRPTATELLGSYAREWWAHVTVGERQGWLLIPPTLQLIGADACGTPPPWRSG